MLHDFVHPKDWWIVIVSIVGITYSTHNGKLRIFGLLLVVLTTIFVAKGYGLLRASLHVALVVLLVTFIKHLTNKHNGRNV